MKHTPGPWEIDWEVSESGPAICGKNGFIFCQVYGDHDKCEANAKLIAAAPELLDAAKMALTVFNNMQYDGMASKLLKRVIEQIEGNKS